MGSLSSWSGAAGFPKTLQGPATKQLHAGIAASQPVSRGPGGEVGRKAKLTASLTQESQCPMAPFHCVASTAVVLEASGGLWVIIYRSGWEDKACVAGC